MIHPGQPLSFALLILSHAQCHEGLGPCSHDMYVDHDRFATSIRLDGSSGFEHLDFRCGKLEQRWTVAT